MKDIKLIVLDVDGTLTDGKLYLDNNRNEIKTFNVKDGIALAKWIALGGRTAIITGRESNIVKNRAIELGIHHIKQNVKNKSNALKEILQYESLDLREVCYIGDDINDIGIMSKVGFPCCPSDSCAEVIKLSNYVSKAIGGNGAVREVLEKIMKENGMWKKIIDSYLMEY
ncbi:KdsC family phosphatase [Fusobacterium sp. PH5-44]|uniref:KdsC family phosphatase n=1 Tax=unclassified Fusobacterium TaxID=2648384 RepID=UPI003D1B9705